MTQTENVKTKWDLTMLGIDEKTFKADRDLESVLQLYTEFAKKWNANTGYLRDPNLLLEALDEYEQLDSKAGSAGNASYYFDLRSAQDQEDPAIKSQNNKIHDISVKIANTMRFFLLNLSKISLSDQDRFLSDPGLSKYRHFLECLFREATHLLSDPEEKILTITSQTSYGNWVQMTSDLVSREEREVFASNKVLKKASVSEIIKLLSDPDKSVRDKAATEFNSILLKHSDIAEAEINSILQSKKNIDELRGYTRPDEARILSDDMSVEVVDSLLEAVTSGFSLSRNYYAFKAKLFGQPKLAYHERNMDYGSLNKTKYPFPKAVELVKTVFASLDSEFSDIFESYLANGQLDVFPYKGKHSGAFCAGGDQHQPGYVLLNHTDILTDVTTIAHEMGHAINNEMIRKSQHSLYFDTPLATAEVASTFMEDFVLQHLETKADEELKLSLLVKSLDEDVSTIMRQVACYRFEQDLHTSHRQKGYLSKKDIGEIFTNNMHSYMGDAIEYTEGSENWWVYWSHIRSFFYVYSYASGLLISKALQALYKKDRSFMTQIKEFLSAGTSDSPEHIFMNLGIDIRQKVFWQQGLKQTADNLDLAQKLAAKLGKI